MCECQCGLVEVGLMVLLMVDRAGRPQECSALTAVTTSVQTEMESSHSSWTVPQHLLTVG